MGIEKVKVEELADLFAYRRDRFGLIADTFAQESSEQSIAQIIAHASAFEKELDGLAEATLNKGLNALVVGELQDFATKTRTEYARLFLGPRSVKAPLHESAYLSGVSRTFTTETLAVRKFYEHYGYVVKAKNVEPDDAIATEFEFLRNLCDRCLLILREEDTSEATLEKINSLVQAQKVFKEQHLNRWAKEFAYRVVEHDQSGYYRAWAKYLIDVLDEDEELQKECEKIVGENTNS